MKLEIRLHDHQFGIKTRSGSEVVYAHSDWLMRSELGYLSVLFQALNDGAVTLSCIISLLNELFSERGCN